MHRYLLQTPSQSNDYHNDCHTHRCHKMPQLKREDAKELQADQHTHEHNRDPLCLRKAPEVGALCIPTHKLEGEAPNVVGDDEPGQCSSRLGIAQDKEASYQANRENPEKLYILAGKEPT